MGRLRRAVEWGGLIGVLIGPVACASQETPRSDAVVRLPDGTEIADPYRWMEAMSSPSVERWVTVKDQAAREFAAAYAGRDALRQRIAAAAAHERYLAPVERGGRYFYVRVNASFTRASILVQDGLDGEPRTLVDGEELAARGLVADRSVWPSPDGSLLAYGVSSGGSGWMEVRFRDVATGRDLPDRLRGLQGGLLSSLSWSPAGDGVYYDGFAPPDSATDARAQQLTDARLAFHRLGDPQADDELWLKVEGTRVMLQHWLTDDGKFVVVAEHDAAKGTDRVHVFPAGDPDADVVLTDGTEAPFRFAGSDGDEIWLYTTAGAPNGRVVGIHVDDPRPAAWRDVVPEQSVALDTWTGIRAVGDRLVGGYRNEGLLELRVFRPGEVRGEVLDLPRIGSVWFGVQGRQGDPEIFFLLSGFADPGTVYRHDLDTGATSVFLAPDLPFDPARYVTRVVMYPSASGREAPMYLAHRRDVEPGPDASVLMYGYGFGGWSVSPWFRPHMSEWFDMGAVFALPALRGGGEFGEEWASAALRERRQNAVDDFVAAGRWLVQQGLASAGRLVAETNSAGGPVVGAAVVQNPDLFGAAILGFPLLDLLRYDQFTRGARWVEQIGAASDPAVARALAQLSPVHAAVPGTCYPPILVTPGERDETTPPFHAYKFVAALQNAQGCDAPILLRLSRGAGHAYGRDQETTVDNLADQLAFLARVLGLAESTTSAAGAGP